MRRTCLGLSLMLLAGCQTVSGFPDAPTKVVYAGPSRPANSLEQAEVDALGRYHHAADTERAGLSPQDYRNSFIYSELGAIDEAFNLFLKKLRTNRATFNMVSSATLLSLNGISATTGGAATKAAIAAASAGLVGQKSAIDQELFNAETLAALIGRMKASRLNALVPIRAGMKQGLSDYPLEAALVDLKAYREAGNLLATLDRISTDAGVEAKHAQDQIIRLDLGKVNLATPQAIEDRIDSAVDAIDAIARKPDGAARLGRVLAALPAPYFDSVRQAVPPGASASAISNVLRPAISGIESGDLAVQPALLNAVEAAIIANKGG